MLKDLIILGIVYPIICILIMFVLAIFYTITTIFGVLINISVGWEIGSDHFCNTNTLWAGCFLTGLIGNVIICIGVLLIIVIICTIRHIRNNSNCNVD